MSFIIRVLTITINLDSAAGHLLLPGRSVLGQCESCVSSLEEHRADVHERRDVVPVHEEAVAVVPGDCPCAQLARGE